MRLLRTFTSDIKKIANSPYKIICMLGIVALPLMYSMIYLAAMWNPYGNLDRVPVALVCSDQGVNLFGFDINLGEDLSQELKASGTMKWITVDTMQEAQDGVNKGDYYMLIHIPEDFSSNLASLAGENPQRAAIEYMVNEKNNYLMSFIAENGLAKIKETLKTNIYKTIAQKLQGVMEDYATVFGDAHALSGLANGTNKLYQSSAMLAEGAKRLEESASNLQGTADQKLEASHDDIDGALHELQDNRSKTKKESEQAKKALTDKKERLLNMKKDINDVKADPSDFVKETDTAIDQVLDDNIVPSLFISKSDSTALAKDLTDSVLDGINSAIDTKLDSYVTKANQISPLLGKLVASQVKELKSNLHQKVNENHDVLQSTLINMSADVRNVANEQLDDVNKQLSGSLSSIKKGISAQTATSLKSMNVTEINAEIDSTCQSIDDAIAQMDTVSDRLDTALSDSIKITNDHYALMRPNLGNAQETAKVFAAAGDSLSGALETISQASMDMSLSMNRISNEIGEYLRSGRDAEVLSEPIEIKNNSIYHIDLYAHGLAPYFISLSLWVGGIGIFFIFKPKNTEGVHLLSKTILMSTITILQAAASCVAAQMILRMHIDNIVLFYLFTVLSALAFAAVIRMLMMLFMNMHEIGEFIAIFLLMLQLTSCGGLYPVETSPYFFRVIHAFLPMTYSVKGMRETVLGSYGNILYLSTIALLCIWLACSIISFFIALPEYRHSLPVISKRKAHAVSRARIARRHTGGGQSVASTHRHLRK